MTREERKEKLKISIDRWKKIIAWVEKQPPGYRASRKDMDDAIGDYWASDILNNCLTWKDWLPTAKRILENLKSVEESV